MSKQDVPNIEVESLKKDLEVTLQQVAALKQNQNALIQENEQLRTLAENLQQGKMIYKKLLDVKKDLGAISKDQKNSAQGFKFRGIDQFVNAIHPVLNKHGVGIRMNCVQNAEEYITNDKGKTVKNTRVMMQYAFFAEDGSEVVSQVPAEGVDFSDKGTNKALSAALKYCLIQMFCIPTEDMAEADAENVEIGKTEGTTPTKEAVAKNTKGKAVKADEVEAPKAKKSFRRKPKKVESADVEL